MIQSTIDDRVLNEQNAKLRRIVRYLDVATSACEDQICHTN